MSVHEHKQNKLFVKCMVLTISDTRTERTDKSGKLMVTLLEEAGHHIEIKEIIQDESTAIKEITSSGLENPNVDIILMNGGTGIAYRDVTIETIQPMFEKEITGFGELFRMLSFQEDIGSSAILSRAIAGVSKNTAIFAIPGSSGAVKLAMERLILPELSHIAHEIKKDIKDKDNNALK
ncbi:MogA/MoaB family molybdenum cofactor biosynthesis protein [Virgibacillus salinus]|uniref:Molybdenum cofactor biosynthesis protein B n=1 Tax=Virgibacillus salinus TaxID=553311 RepID=A0A1H1AT34_9BACI|nr:MogA/MoaB family molybdenum cofactor biosynthesis protein [Virgibacillus salinus]SDQ42887.1 molybdopterin adenylyltransferase [Virgibacillus salinus]